MRLRLFILLLLTSSAALAQPIGPSNAGPALNKDGSVVTGLLTARFDPRIGLDGVPVPNNLFFSGTTDLTVNASTAGLSPAAAGLVTQLNSLDGFSTIERWTTTFVVDDQGNPGAIDPASVVPGQSVRVFQVTTAQILFVTGIVRELTPGVDYTAVASGNVVAIVPLKPLAEYSSFMAVMTNDIKDTSGNNATPDTLYFLSQADTPWVDANGNSTYPLLPDSSAQAAEGLRQITGPMEAAAASAGINPDDIILSWTVQTQSITPVLGQLRATVEPAPVIMGPRLGSTADLGIGLPGFADFYQGVITIPYYSGIPGAENPIAPLVDFWTAEPGAYVPPFDQLGLDPTSINLTVANPFPAVTGIQTVPVIVTVPSAQSGMVKPPGGWPVVVYGHGITRSRGDLLLLGDNLAAGGFAGVAIDFPLHGVTPQDPLYGPLYIGDTPFGEFANERTFDVDYFDNQTLAPPADGIIDPSGVHALNFQEFRTTRDNVRQGIIDLSVLTSSLANFDLDGDSVGDLRPMNVAFAGHSWGGINGTAFVGLEPLIDRAFLTSPAGGLVRAANASASYGPRIRAGLESIGIFPGDPLFELYLTVGQTVADPADPINWIANAAMAKPILLQEVIGDLVLPNAVAGAPLSGTEPMIRIAALESFSTTQVNPDGLRVASRFVPPAEHSTFINPAPSLAATVEMRGQMVSFFASDGTLVQVSNEDTMVPVMMMTPGAEAVRPQNNLVAPRKPILESFNNNGIRADVNRNVHFD